MDSKKSIVEQIFHDVISGIETDIEKCSSITPKFACGLKIPAYYPIDKFEEEIASFQIENGIKHAKKGSVVGEWDREYINEVLSVFFTSILESVRSNVRGIELDLINKLEFLPESEVEKIIMSLINKYYEGIENYEGRLYYDESFRRAEKPKYIGRTDVLWYKFASINNLQNRVTHPKEYLGCDEYPFVVIPKRTWENYENAYRLVKPIKGLLEKLSLNQQTDEPEYTSEKYFSEIFVHKNVEHILEKVLQQFKGIDESKQALKNRFMPICDAFWTLFSGDSDLIYDNAKKASFLRHLNGTYSWKSKKLSNGDKHKPSVKEYTLNLPEYKEIKNPPKRTV